MGINIIDADKTDLSGKGIEDKNKAHNLNIGIADADRANKTDTITAYREGVDY